jgi:hypothetical protein
MKVFDEHKKDFIELVEKNPRTNSKKNDESTSIIKFDKATGDEYSDICYFANTQERPFKTGIFNINFANKRFNIQFYLPGYERPLSYYPSKLKRNKHK